MDPVEFLRTHEPFSRLDESGLARVRRSLEIVYARAGESLLSREGPRGTHLWVVRKGAVRLEVDGRSIDVLGEGEIYGFPSLLSRGSPQFDVRANEDCLLYGIPDAEFQKLIAEQARFGEFFLESLAGRLRLATERTPTPLVGDLMTPVVQLRTREPVLVDATATVGEAAKTMRDLRIGSVLVRGEPMGILTDRDLRSRVLAEGLGPETPVAQVMSAPLKAFPADAPLYEALLFLLRERIHHLALTRDGDVVGVVTDTDLLRHHVKSPSYLLKRIDRFADVADLGAYGSEIAGMVEALRSSGLDATDIGRVVASLNDAVVQRILRLAIRELGEPPCPYTWIVFGSEGRREQTLLTDQDNALVFRDDDETARSYFPKLAERVVADLTRASFPPCAGGFMATNWHRSLGEWERLFDGWISSPDPQALMEVANFFDFRAIGGRLDLTSLQERIREGARQQTFLAQLARASLRMTPPLGLFHRIREGEEGVDLKAGGIMPIVGLARVHALEAGSTARSTLRRLDAAAQAGTLSRDGAETLAEGYRFLFTLRLSAQLRAVREARPVSNHVHLDQLSSLERRHLKETFLHIRMMQEAMTQRYRLDLLG
jgi:CBS domain-containing protein